MIDDVADFLRCQADVDADQHRADHGNGKMRFQHGRDVGADEGDLVSFLNADFFQGAGQLIDPCVEFLVSIALVVIDNGCFVRINHGGPADEMNRR